MEFIQIKEKEFILKSIYKKTNYRMSTDDNGWSQKVRMHLILQFVYSVIGSLTDLAIVSSIARTISLCPQIPTTILTSIARFALCNVIKTSLVGISSCRTLSKVRASLLGAVKTSRARFV